MSFVKMQRFGTAAVFILVTLVLVASSGTAAATKWRALKDGIGYTEINISPGSIHAFRINPKKYKFGVITAKDVGDRSSSVKKMAKKKGALIAINGGFFTPEYASLGLLVDSGKTINPLKNTSWWSIFYIRKGVPRIVHTNGFKKDNSIQMAVQSGPRLVVNGSIPKLKPSIAERSAICVNGKGEVLIAATENLLIQPKDFAEHLRKSEGQGGLGCKTALNLDGGRSTQIFADIDSFHLNVSGINTVANAVAVYPKK